MKNLFITAILLYAALWGYNKANHNFYVSNITLKHWVPLEHSPSNTADETKEAQAILHQPFKYLAKGRQSFIFESEDKKYVLKFIKCQRINVSDTYEKFPLPAFLDKKRKNNLLERDDRLKRMFTSMALAKDPLKELTGILYLHITPTQELQKTVTLIDRLGFSHSVVIDSVPFILQKKADKVFPVLKKLMKAKDTKGLKVRLDQLINLFVQRASLGIIDPDKGLLTRNNIGFIEDRAIYIDLGTFKRSAKSASRKYLAPDLKKLAPIVRWLKSHDKQLARQFVDTMNTAVQTYEQK